MLDFDFISFGNAYFLQSDCPGYPSYDRSDGVPCWQTKCGVDSPPDGCFDVDNLVCQHGDDECTGNLIETCVKSLKPDFADYMAFNYCYEASFPPSSSQLAACAEAAGLSTDDIDACTSDTDLVASLQQSEGYKTAQALIPGTPTLIMSGESISVTRLSPLLKQVCAEFQNLNPGEDVPAGCSREEAVSLRGSVSAA